MSGAALGSLALLLEGVAFFMLQEPDFVPKAVLRMVDTPAYVRPSHLRKYLAMTVRLWGGHIAGPILAVIAIVLGIAAAFYVGDPSASAKIVKWTALLTGLAAVLLVFRAQYDAWECERELGEKATENRDRKPGTDGQKTGENRGQTEGKPGEGKPGTDGTYPNCLAQHGKAADWRDAPCGISNHVFFHSPPQQKSQFL